MGLECFRLSLYATARLCAVSAVYIQVNSLSLDTKHPYMKLTEILLKLISSFADEPRLLVFGLIVFTVLLVAWKL